jgi:hypothetical protein
MPHNAPGCCHPKIQQKILITYLVPLNTFAEMLAEVSYIIGLIEDNAIRTSQ